MCLRFCLPLLNQQIGSEGMTVKLLLLFLICFSPGVLSQDNSDVTIIVEGSDTVAEIDDTFICATLDWWPPEKCNYNDCPWGQSSILNLNLSHPFLAKAIEAFKPMRIRAGGSLQDQLIYGVPSLSDSCKPFSKKASGLFGFSDGCLSMDRWDELNALFEKTGAVVTFGLNALYGRHRVKKGIWGGDWNSSNAIDFINYTISMEYPVDSWEFGNELSGHGVSASVSAEQYGKDLVTLKAILKDLYKNSASEPLLVAPGGFFDLQWYAKLLQITGFGVLDALTHHIYNLGAGNDPKLPNKITDPQYLSKIADTFRNVQLTIERHGSWASAWVSEAGGAFNSGSRLVSNKFLNSFWYIDQLGMAAKYNTKVYCRQTLIGGNYGLLDKKTFIPNPDYYSALLWHRLMGKGVLSLDISGSSYLRAYAHCSKGKSGISIVLINLSKTTQFSVNVRNDLNIILSDGGIQKDSSFIYSLKKTLSWIGRRALDGSEMREEYHLTGEDGNSLSRIVLLNGNPLQLSEDGDIPALQPVQAAVNSPIFVDPLSIAFVVFPKFEAQSCS